MEKQRLLIDRKTYLRHLLPIGKGKNKLMEKFIFKELPNGYVIFNVKEVDRRIRLLAKHLVNKDIMIINRNKRFFYSLKKFEEITGIKVYLGRFLPGTFTNYSSENFREPDAILVFDLVNDKQAVREAYKMNIPIFALCNSKSNPSKVDFIIPINNKSKKSIALFLYLLAREILLLRGQIKSYKDFNYKIEDFLEEKTAISISTK
ncbi:MAG: 30S ribosomal protein S2 [Candidatus Aenigmatarchaeota archaeon]